MRAKLEQLLYFLRGSYWFVPSVMALTAILASQLMVQLDRTTDLESLTPPWWNLWNQPDGARALLATVAGSMITVAGVTFSLTMVVVSYATSHFGPRLLDNFMRNRGNQITLGTFIATFLYCLLVLRTIRGTNPGSEIADNTTFVPHFAVAFGLLLTIASVAVLIYFIHHVPESIHISNVLDDVSAMAKRSIEKMYPNGLGHEADDASITQPDWSLAYSVQHPNGGYLQGIDEQQILAWAHKQDLMIKLQCKPGQFLLPGQTIGLIHERSPHEELSEQQFTEQQQETANRVCSAMAVGNTRTPTQDVDFALNQLVEIAARALSPGVNDPFTAMQCTDRLASALAIASKRKLPSRLRVDEEGALRVVATQTSWRDLAETAIGQLIPYVVKDANAANYLVMRLRHVQEISPNESLNAELEQYCERIAQQSDK